MNGSALCRRRLPEDPPPFQQKSKSTQGLLFWPAFDLRTRRRASLPFVFGRISDSGRVGGSSRMAPRHERLADRAEGTSKQKTLQIYVSFRDARRPTFRTRCPGACRARRRKTGLTLMARMLGRGEDDLKRR